MEEIRKQLDLMLEKYSIKKKTLSELLQKLNSTEEANEIVRIDIALRFINEATQDLNTIKTMVRDELNDEHDINCGCFMCGDDLIHHLYCTCTIPSLNYGIEANKNCNNCHKPVK